MIWGSLNTGAWSFSYIDGGGGEKGFHPLKVAPLPIINYQSLI